MTVPVLLVSTATRWYGTARTPRALAKAGFDVTLLTPRNSLAEKSRFVTRVAYLADDTTPLDWIHAVAATVRAVSPVQIMPCDDLSFRLLAMLAVQPPPQLQPALQAGLAKLVRASLGEPDHYRTSVDKTLQAPAAALRGVRVPAHAVVTHPDEAIAFAAGHRYPLVVKRPLATAGNGARIVAAEAELVHAVNELAAQRLADLETDASRRVVVQQHIDGHVCYQSVAAWQGRLLASYAGDRLQSHDGPTSQGTVVRYRHAPDVQEFAERFVQAFGMSGLFTSEYMVERESGLAYLIEINRRIGPATHHGAALHVDLCAALYAAVHGTESRSRASLAAGEERVFVQFPGEWLRDPRSRWLREHAVDVPWDDPTLLDAMLALRRER